MSPFIDLGTGAGFTESNDSDTPNGVMPIAVVGMGFRGPGEATDPDSLWKMIEERQEAWSPVPKDRWNHEAFYHPDSNRNGTTNVLGGHFMRQDLHKFDAPFFSMTKADSEALDPQQRLLLECSYEALENAGIPMEKVAGSKTCCFVGSFCGDYTDLLSRDPETMPFYQATSSGHSRAIIANRLSYFFDLRGPCATIDTACSASLVALHLACQSMRSGETKQALVAGANVVLSHEMTISMTMMRFLSPDGRCYSFDERANGYSRGEGVGCVFLKPLADALRDGDPIRAVIRNTGVNQDGKTAGITLPNREAQENLIKSVYAEANIDPRTTSFVECHGTGTPAGDPLETGAIANIFTKDRPEGSPPLRIGSVKANIGHLEGASGIAGLIKAVLMLEKDKILPNRNFETPSKRIPFKEWNLKVPIEVEDFGVTGPRIVSVNSFGYGGTNAHTIVQDAASCIKSAMFGQVSATGVQVNGNGHLSVHGRSSLNGAPNGHGSHHGHAGFNGIDEVEEIKSTANGLSNGFTGTDNASSSTQIFILSAFEEKTVGAIAESLVRYLEKSQSDNETQELENIAYTLSERRTKLPFKLAVHASSKEELISFLVDSSLRAVRATKNAALGFVFTGQGAQWWAMGRELFARFPVFSQSISAAVVHLKYLGADWDLKEELFKDSTSTRVNDARISQPVCTALQVALVDLLASFGIRPAAVTGHSSGEIAAAYCAGALSRGDAISASYYRGLMSKLARERSPVPGAMMAIGMSETEAAPLLANLKDGKVGVACVNSAESLTVSGDETGVDELKVILDERKIFARKLAVDVAYHSHHMAYVAEDYLKAISQIKPITDTNRDCIFYSAVTGQQASAQMLGPQYWVDNMLGRVKFESALREMCESQIPEWGPKTKKRGSAKRTISALCEVGPHSALAGPVRQILGASALLRHRGISVMSCLVRNKDAEHTIADAICKLSVMGFPVDISAFNAATSMPALKRPKVLSSLPHYPWSHTTSYWAEPRVSKEQRLRPYCRSDLLGVPVPHFNPSEPRWRNIIRIGELPWVKDHRVQGSVVYPAAGFVAMAIEATVLQARERSFEATAFELREVSIGQALVLPDDRGEVEVILSLRPFSDSVRSPSDLWNEFSISSVSLDNRWTEHSRGLVKAVASSKPDSISTPDQLNSEKLRIAEFVQRIDGEVTAIISPEDFYEKLSKLGLDYGPTFANVKSLQCGRNTAVSSMRIADTASVMPNNFEYPFVLHPSTLDCLFHPLFAALGLAGSGTVLQDPFVPVLIDRLVLSTQMRTQPEIQLHTWTEAKRFDDRQICASTVVFDSEISLDEPVLQIEGLNCTKIAREEVAGQQGQSNKANFGYQTSWLPDVDEMSSSDFASMCRDLVPDTGEEDAILSFEKAGYFLMKRAFGQITDADLQKAHSHHKRLYNCMRAMLAKQDEQCATGDDTVEAFLDDVSSTSAEGNLLVHIGRNLVPIIRQSRDALELMLEEGRLDAYYRDNWRFDRNYKQATRYLELAAHKNPNMSILEIGSGTGGATLPVLQALTDSETNLCHLGRFTFTDISTGFFEAAKGKLAQWSNLLSYAKLDIEADPTLQGFEEGVYDVILAANVLHATHSMKNTMDNVRRLLKPGGKLILVELTRERFTTSTIFGTLPGWFAGEEEDRILGPTLTEEKWDTLLRDAGFNGLDVAASDARFEPFHQGSMIVATACKPGASSQNTPQMAALEADFLVIHGEPAPASISVENLCHWLQSLGVRTVTTANLASCQPEGKVCIVLSELSASLFQHPTSAEFEKVKAIFTSAPSILWVTKGALINPTDPMLNMVTGFARTVKSEYGNNVVVTLDLDSESTGGAMQFIQALAARHLLQTEPVATSEHEYVERAGQLLIPRFTAHKVLQRSMKALLDPSAYEMVPFDQPDRHLVVEVKSPGLLDTVVFVDDKRLESDLPTNMVEISVKASGMIFKDIMMAMGQIAVETLGGECSGVIHRVGTSVKNLAVGDRVSCYGFGTFANVYRQDATAVQKIPDDMSFELAAALPVNFCTAYYSVIHVARVQKSQTVLIHAASGGLGQALIEICQMVGAEIFCTVGTIEKKQLLIDTYGILEDHIFTSRSALFAPAIMGKTNGRGVDVIMNSVAGEMLRMTWNCIAPFGTFVELGARDYTMNTRLEMAKFAQNVTFASVNLVHLIRERPVVAAQVWANVMDLLRQKKLRGPTPLTAYKMSQLEPALRLMQSGKHLGKLVLVHGEGDLVKATPQTAASKMTLFKADEAYLLVGGMGGIGRAISLWMLEHGARNFIFASRSGLDRVEARELKSILEASGANVVVGKCNVSRIAELESLMSQCGHLPPVKGIIQGAMVLRDCFLSNMQVSEYDAVVKPKVEGTWNLHHLFEKTPLDFFVMLSSTAGIIGNASQAAYAASSTFMDSFALYRRSRGLAASTLDLGVITGIGYVAQNQELAQALERQGFGGTNEEQLMALLHSAILASPPTDDLAQGHMVTGLGTWQEGSMDAFDRPIFSHFRRAGQIISEAANGDSEADQKNGARSLSVRGVLKSAKGSAEAEKAICEGLVAKVSSLTMIAMEDISIDRPLVDYGMDSLVAVEMRNWIAREIDAAVPVLELMANEPIKKLASKILLKSRVADFSKLDS